MTAAPSQRCRLATDRRPPPVRRTSQNHMRSREAYVSACGSAMFAGPAGADDLLRVGSAVKALPSSMVDRRPIDVLLDGLALLITEGRAAAAPTLLQAARLFAGDGGEESFRWGWMATVGSDALWD